MIKIEDGILKMEGSAETLSVELSAILLTLHSGSPQIINTAFFLYERFKTNSVSP